MNTKAFLRFAASIILLFATGSGGAQQPVPPLIPANFAAVTQPPINVPPDPLDSLPPALRWGYLNKSDKPDLNPLGLEHRSPNPFNRGFKIIECIIDKEELHFFLTVESGRVCICR
jgi:hypothetical protein